MSFLPPDLEAKGYALALNTIAPQGNATVTEYAGGYIVKPDSAQSKYLQDLIERKFSTAQKGTKAVNAADRGVKLDLSPVYMPVVLKRAIPVALVLILGGYFLGKVL